MTVLTDIIDRSHSSQARKEQEVDILWFVFRRTNSTNHVLGTSLCAIRVTQRRRRVHIHEQTAEARWYYWWADHCLTLYGSDLIWHIDSCQRSSRTHRQRWTECHGHWIDTFDTLHAWLALIQSPQWERNTLQTSTPGLADYTRCQEHLHLSL